MESVDHGALRLALVNDVRNLGAHALNFSVVVCDGKIEREPS